MTSSAEPTILLERTSLVDQLFAHIKRMILSQELKGGESIHEDKISKAFGVSRTPIRECLLKLEHYGLVTMNPRGQAVITVMGVDEVHYMGEVRSGLETLAVRNLAKKATLEDIEILTKYTREGIFHIENGDRGECFEVDSLFHLEIAKRCGNPYIYDILKTLDAKIQLLRITICTDHTIIHSDVEKHFQIIDAIKNHDGKKAEILMRKHIGSFVNHNSSPDEAEPE